MSKTRVFIAFLLVFSLFNEVSHASDTIPLSCMNKETFSLRVSNVIKGCEKTEILSIDAGATGAELLSFCQVKINRKVVPAKEGGKKIVF